MKWTLGSAALLLSLGTTPWALGFSIPALAGSTALLMGWIALAIGCKDLPSAKKPLLALALIGIVLRLPVLFEDPTSSDDLWRYLWEGRVTEAGENPARIPPNSQRLEQFRDDHVYARVNHPSISSIYLPFAQAAFLLTQALGGSVLAWKLILMALELLAGWTLARQARSCQEFVLWFLNPILLRESAEAGHIDSLGASCLLMGLALRGPWMSSLAIWASVMVKPVAAPLAFFRMRARSTRVPILLTGLLALASLAWFVREPTLQFRSGSGNQAMQCSSHGWNPVSIASLHAYPTVEPGLFTPLSAPEEQTLLPSLDRRCAISFGPDGSSAVFSNRTAREWTPWSSVKSQHLIGRYFAITLSTQPCIPLQLDFDARQEVLVKEASTVTPLNYYVDGERSIIIYDSANNRTWAELEISESDLQLRGTMANSARSTIFAFKAAESPLMGFQQFGGRWSGFNLLHDWAQSTFGSRRAVHIMAAMGALALALIAMWFQLPSAVIAVLIAAWFLACLPQIHPWYVIWLLPGALRLNNQPLRVVLAVAVASVIFFGY